MKTPILIAVFIAQPILFFAQNNLDTSRCNTIVDIDEENEERLSWDLDTLSTQAEITSEYVIKKHLEALGGLEKLKNVKTLQLTMSIDVNGQELLFNYYTIDDSIASTQWEIFNQQGYTIFDKTKGYSLNPIERETKPSPMTKEELRLLSTELDLQGHFIDQKQKGYVSVYKGIELVDNQNCYTIQTTIDEDRTITEYIDINNFMIIKAVDSYVSKGKKESKIVSYCDYMKTPYGITIAYKYITSLGMEFNLKNIQINRPIDSSVYNILE